PDRAAVAAAQADLQVGERAMALQALHDGPPLLGLEVDAAGPVAHQVLRAGEAQDARAGLVALDDAPVDRVAEHAGQVALEEQAVAGLRRALGGLGPAPLAHVAEAPHPA